MIETIKYQGKDYKLVPARLKQFREENPRAAIDSNAVYNPDNSVTIKTKIIKDRSDEYSAVASGSARYSADEIKKAKAYEKLETISVGRALANMGYLNDGQVATTEEMDEFYSFRENKAEEAVAKLNSATDIDKLRDTFMKLGTLMKDPKVIAAKDAKKAELSK